MKKTFIISFFLFSTTIVTQAQNSSPFRRSSQPKTQTPANQTPQSSTPTQNEQTRQTTQTTQTTTKYEFESIWLTGSLGGGLVASSNIVNSGAVFMTNVELMGQKRHHRIGLGYANELYITPESLTRFVLGQGIGVKKLYFTYELFVFRNFPINLGFSSHLGFFGAGNSQDNSRGGAFGNVGVVLELGIRPVYLFVRPSIEYKTWSSFHKEIMASGSVGLRLKFLTNYEIERRAQKRRDRDHIF